MAHFETGKEGVRATRGRGDGGRRREGDDGRQRRRVANGSPRMTAKG